MGDPDMVSTLLLDICKTEHRWNLLCGEGGVMHKEEVDIRN